LAEPSRAANSSRAVKPARRAALEQLYDSLEAYERLYQFRDPNNACLFDLRVNECYVLELVVERGSLAVVEIAAALGIHKSNASRIANALRDKGFVSAETDALDRRSVRLKASAKGLKRYRALRSYLIARFAATLRGVSTAEIRTVARALVVLTGDAEERMKSQRST